MGRNELVERRQELIAELEKFPDNIHVGEDDDFDLLFWEIININEQLGISK